MEKEIINDSQITLRIIEKLLSTPLGEQIYSREIKILFDILELQSKPIFIY